MNNLKIYSRIFKDAGKYSRTTRCFSRIKDKTSFDSKFKDNSWRSRTSGNLKFECYHSSVMHLSTHQGNSLGHKIAHVHHVEKQLMEQVLYTFLGKKEHHLFCCNQKWFRVKQHSHHKYSEDIAAHKYWGWTHIYHHQTLDDSKPYFPQCIPPWVSPAALRVHPGK